MIWATSRLLASRASDLFRAFRVAGPAALSCTTMMRLLLALTILASFGALPVPLPAQLTSTAAGFEYFRQPDFELPLVSPGGQSVGFIARTNGRGWLFRNTLTT